LLTSGILELLDHLHKHRNLDDGASLTQQKGVPLGLPQLLAQFANDMKFQLGIPGQTSA
jgi:hypothetical protein